MAREAVERLIAQLARGGRRAVGVGILGSSGRTGSDLAAILASHALIHTAEGEHFRTALAGAAGRCGLAVVRVPARELESRAGTAIGKPIQRLQLMLKEQGRRLGPPWGVDQKAAALLAWLVLASGRE
jgi:hypothetical protein